MLASKAHKLGAVKRTEDIAVCEEITFEGLLLSEPTLKGLQACDFEKPSPIQLKAIPFGKCGFDLIAQAKSGTGKTVMFGVITLEMLQLPSKSLQVLILAPTREIAIQVCGVLTAIGQGHKGVRVASFIGGLPVDEDRQRVRTGCHVAVGTPGRVRQLVDEGLLKLDHVRLVVLDEADRLLDESFITDVSHLLVKLPENRQTIASSATYTDDLKNFLENIMRSPIRISPYACQAEGGGCVLLGVRQCVGLIRTSRGTAAIKMKRKLNCLVHILSNIPFKQCLVFNNMHEQAQSLSHLLTGKGWPTQFISGRMEQPLRLKAIQALVDFECRVLLSTDLSARGLDAANVDLVVNMDIPRQEATYLHRVGRAGRFGTHGLVITIAEDSGEDLERLHDIIQKTLVTLGCFQLDPDFPLTPELLNQSLPSLQDVKPDLRPRLVVQQDPPQSEGESETAEVNEQESGGAGDVEPPVENSIPPPQPMEAEDEEDDRTVSEKNVDLIIASLKLSPTNKEPARTTPPTKPPRKMLPKALLPDIVETEQRETTPLNGSFDGWLQVESSCDESEGSSCNASPVKSVPQGNTSVNTGFMEKLLSASDAVSSQKEEPVKCFGDIINYSSLVKSVTQGSSDLPVDTGSIEKLLPPHAAVSPQKEEPVKCFGDIINYPGGAPRVNHYPREFQSQRFGGPMAPRDREISRDNWKPWEKPSYLYTEQPQQYTPRTPRVWGKPKEINIDRALKRLTEEVDRCQERILPRCSDYNLLEKQLEQFLLYPSPMPQPERPRELHFDLTYLCDRIYRLNGRAVLNMQHNFHMQGGVKACLTLMADGKDIENREDNFNVPTRSEWTLGHRIEDPPPTADPSVDQIPSAPEVDAGVTSEVQDHQQPEIPEVVAQGGVKKKIPRAAPVEEKSVDEPSTSQFNGTSPVEFPPFPMDPNADLEKWKEQVKLVTFYMHYTKYMEYMNAPKK